MNQAVDDLKTTTFGGRHFTRKQIKQIQSTVNGFPNLSRRELANTICEHFDWLTPGGNYSSQSCLNALEQMEAASLLKLPVKNESNIRDNKRPIKWTTRTDEKPNVTEELDSLLPIQLLPVSEPSDTKLWNEYIDIARFNKFATNS